MKCFAEAADTNFADNELNARSIISILKTLVPAHTVEHDRIPEKRGGMFVATLTVLAFGLGSGGATAADVANPGTVAWLMPASVGSIGAGLALLLTGWLRSRGVAHSSGSSPMDAVPMAAVDVPMPTEATSTSVFCTECGAANAASRKFCGQCGHELERP